MSNNEDPKPGTPEYDQMMVDRYRAQRDGAMDAPLTDGGIKADSYDHHVDDKGNVRLSIRRDSTLGPAHQPERFTADMADPLQLAGLEREAERIRAELAEVSGFDSRTGEQVMRYTGEQRRAREVRLDYLERTGIPGAAALQAQATAWRAQNVPSTLQILSDEKARRDRLSIRAQEIADEREAQALADRVQAERRSKD